jgi:hypothetical protein
MTDLGMLSLSSTPISTDSGPNIVAAIAMVIVVLLATFLFLRKEKASQN